MVGIIKLERDINNLPAGDTTVGYYIDAEGRFFLGGKYYPTAQTRVESYSFGDHLGPEHRRGAHLIFENGWTLSIQWGTGNYGTNYRFGWDKDHDEFVEEATTAEMAAWNNNWPRIGRDFPAVGEDGKVDFESEAKQPWFHVPMLYWPEEEFPGHGGDNVIGRVPINLGNRIINYIAAKASDEPYQLQENEYFEQTVEGESG